MQESRNESLRTIGALRNELRTVQNILEQERHSAAELQREAASASAQASEQGARLADERRASATYLRDLRTARADADVTAQLRDELITARAEITQLHASLERAEADAVLQDDRLKRAAEDWNVACAETEVARNELDALRQEHRGVLQVLHSAQRDAAARKRDAAAIEQNTGTAELLALRERLAAAEELLDEQAGMRVQLAERTCTADMLHALAIAAAAADETAQTEQHRRVTGATALELLGRREPSQQKHRFHRASPPRSQSHVSAWQPHGYVDVSLPSLVSPAPCSPPKFASTPAPQKEDGGEGTVPEVAEAKPCGAVVASSSALMRSQLRIVMQALGYDVTACAASPRSANVAVAQQHGRCVTAIVDATTTEGNAVSTVRTLCEQPEQLIVLGLVPASEAEAAPLRDAMRAVGAKDFVAQPPHRRSLAAPLHAEGVLPREAWALLS